MYNNYVWTDITGTTREISKMNSIHLCFVIIQCTHSKNKNGLSERMNRMIDELKARIRCHCFSEEEFYEKINSLRNGDNYIFYSNESNDINNKLNNYYISLINRYIFVDPPVGVFN